MRATTLTLALIGLAGCLKPAAPITSMTRMPVRLALVLEPYDGPAEAAPDKVAGEVAAEVARRNLEPEVVPVEGPLASARTTDARLGLLAAADGAGVNLLIECAPRFSAQVAGRYRWTVDVTAVLQDATTALDDAGDRREFSVPVHLLYDHQGGAEALEQASPLVVREIGRLLDGWISEMP